MIPTSQVLQIPMRERERQKKKKKIERKVTDSCVNTYRKGNQNTYRSNASVFCRSQLFFWGFFRKPKLTLDCHRIAELLFASRAPKRPTVFNNHTQFSNLWRKINTPRARLHSKGAEVKSAYTHQGLAKTTDIFSKHNNTSAQDGTSVGRALSDHQSNVSSANTSMRMKAAIAGVDLRWKSNLQTKEHQNE